MVRGQKKTEIILYVVLWIVLFAAPVISMLVGDFFVSSPEDALRLSAATSASTFSFSIDWQGVWNAWSLLAMFCITFFIHNFFIAPLLVYGNRKWTYGCLVLLLFVGFLGFQFCIRPHHPEPGMNNQGEPRMEQNQRLNQQQPNQQQPNQQQPNQQQPNQQQPNQQQPNQQQPNQQPPYERLADERNPYELPTGKQPQYEDVSFDNRENRVPPHRPKAGRGEPMRPDLKFDPPRAFGGQDSVAFIIMSLLLGLNVGTKYFFKSLDDKKRIKELERENLNRQLEYLKYQINPHFFMNTLNNIHALVDIDPEQAKYTIEVLSKLMRYVLYEGNKTMAPLQKELDFIRHYVDLMKIRYTDRVRISVSLPTISEAVSSPTSSEVKKDEPSSALNLMDIQVPSLLFTTFVENAFKHGVSYQQDSFIEVSVRVDETAREIYFLCNNSRKPEAEEKRKGGVGLENAKKRLALIYGDEYELKIDAKQEEYRLLLRLPIKQM